MNKEEVSNGVTAYRSLAWNWPRSCQGHLKTPGACHHVWPISILLPRTILTPDLANENFAGHEQTLLGICLGNSHPVQSDGDDW